MKLFRNTITLYKKIIDNPQHNITKYSFGATSAIISSLALIIGLNINSFSKIGIIGSLLVIAIADNISDTLGIHIYQEGERLKNKDVWISTFTNFITRLLVVSIFIIFIIFLPSANATFTSIIYGFTVLTIISFIIAKKRKTSAIRCILEHILIAGFVIIGTKLLSDWIRNNF